MLIFNFSEILFGVVTQTINEQLIWPSSQKLVNNLCIQVFNSAKTDFEEIKFFETDLWDMEAEKLLLFKIQEIFAITRGNCKSFEMKINMEVSDVRTAYYLVNKKISGHIEIHNQKLSIREIEVLGLIMQGLTNIEIAEKLFISYETVKTHRKHILEKTDAKNTAALINYYHQTFFEK